MENKLLQQRTTKQDESLFNQVMLAILSRTIEISQCQSNGFRLKKDNDFPFYIHEGYPNFFIKKESNLLSKDNTEKIKYDQKGNKILDCMCGNIIAGHFNSDFPFFSKKGSFWTNNTTKLLSNITKEQRETIGPTRNLCNLSGYESVALIPLKTNGHTTGLIHIADPRKNMFTIEKISKLERIADQFASIIKQAYEIQEKLLEIDKIISKSEN